jgi:hypothetical protein
MVIICSHRADDRASPCTASRLQTKISHTRSRYIYDLYYKREAISKDLYDWLLKEQYADAKSVPERPHGESALRLTLSTPPFCSLVAKWKKQGYEKLCACPSAGRMLSSPARAHPDPCCVPDRRLPEVHPDQGHELPGLDVHLPRAQVEAEGGPDDPVRCVAYVRILPPADQYPSTAADPLLGLSTIVAVHCGCKGCSSDS